ncbi:Leucine-rich repeat-containing G-protein coupled receptor [Dirofilaria immitis]
MLLPILLIISLLLIISYPSQCSTSELLLPCSYKCHCENFEMIYCDGANFERIPTIWQTTIRILHIKNSSLQIIQKAAFKRYAHLKELIIENCDRLYAIEKFAFKGLNRLKLLRLANNPSLNDLAKNAFSQISSKYGLRIQLVNNSFTRIRQGLFRQLNRLRELTLGGQNLKIEMNAFADLTQVDFFNLFGAISFGQRSFENVSRVHRLEISRSNFSLLNGIFIGLSHVREILITSNNIETIDTGAFTALISEAWKTRFRDNILYCSCVINWLKHINDSMILKKNFCGAEEFHRSLSNYNPICPRSKRGQSSAITTRTLNISLQFLGYLLLYFILNQLNLFYCLDQIL